MARQILVAGLGNIFMGDDAFGVETVQQLARQTLPAEARVMDIGIRSYDLSCALIDDPAALILIDATPRGEKAGTLYLLDLQEAVEKKAWENPVEEIVNAHAMNPNHALQMAKSLCRSETKLYLVGCEPAVLESVDGRIGLSEPVQAAVPEAVAMIQSLLHELCSKEKNIPEANYALEN